MTEITIRSFRPGDDQDVIDMILPIQREEFGVPVTEADQPDLRDIPGFYQSGSGGFWVAECEGRIVGSIGLRDFGGGGAALRKMFVAAPFRGKSTGTGAALLNALLGAAQTAGLRRIYLGTTEHFLAAHRFYEKQGFRRLPPEALPPAFPRMAVDSRFYMLELTTG